jgi:hypothetical protein
MFSPYFSKSKAALTFFRDKVVALRRMTWCLERQRTCPGENDVHGAGLFFDEWYHLHQSVKRRVASFDASLHNHASREAVHWTPDAINEVYADFERVSEILEVLKPISELEDLKSWRQKDPLSIDWLVEAADLIKKAGSRLGVPEYTGAADSIPMRIFC